jgi:ABC-2 type transport system ATP-binding protein
MIEARDLSYWYGRVLALNGLNLTIAPGITGLVGPNGSGKTTFMRLATGLLRPVAGSIHVGGERPWANPPLCRKIGYAPESEISMHGLRGWEYVEFALRFRGYRRSEAPRLAREILDRTGAAAFAAKPISAMSRGMRQRIKLAAALAHDPQVLILDEPLTGSDPVARNEILKLIRQAAAGGRTVLMSTHVLHEIEGLTEQIVLVHRGRLLAQGGIHEIRGLIDRHPHQVRIVTPRRRELASILAREPELHSISFEDTSLVVRTLKPAEFYSKLTRVLAEGDFQVQELSSPDDNLEAVFRYLTER